MTQAATAMNIGSSMPVKDGATIRTVKADKSVVTGVPGKSGVHVSFCEINIYARSVDALASQHVQIPSTISLPRLTEERTMISIWRHCVGHAIEPRLQGSVSGETRPVSAWGGGDQILNPFRF